MMRRRGARLASAVASLAAATALIAMLEYAVGVPSADAVYLLAVMVMGVGYGTWAAVATAFASFLLYDFFFIQPVFTFTVRDPAEWLNLVLLLGVGIVVGQLAALQRSRAEAALARARESRALYAVTRALLAVPQTPATLRQVVDALVHATRMSRIRIALGPTIPQERTVAEGGAPTPNSVPALRNMLRPGAGDAAPSWVALHAGVSMAPGPRSIQAVAVYQLPLEVERRGLGSIWATRASNEGIPDEAETRLLAAAAEQVANALERDRLAAEATSAEVARRSDALKSALLDSVSHDLRTPLASIRAAAGSLMDPDVTWSPEQQRANAAAIDREADRLNRLVTNLLDMSRIEAGALKVEPEACALDDLVRELIERRGELMADREVRLEIPADLPPTLVDPLLIEQVLANILDNAERYTGPGSTVVVRAAPGPSAGSLRLVIEDNGSGVPDETLPRLFDKFYRVPRPAEGSRRGTGTGLSVVRGLVEAMGGHVMARKAEIGGLAIVLDLPTASEPVPPVRTAVDAGAPGAR
jgi:two-component system sensor histidine kinase KdpD